MSFELLRRAHQVCRALRRSGAQLSFLPLGRRVTKTDYQSRPLRKAISIRKDTPPVAANTARWWYEQTGKSHRSNRNLLAAGSAYRLALQARNEAEARCRVAAAGGNLDALAAILSAHESFKEASKQYERTLVAYLECVTLPVEYPLPH
jgi:hypothetical protein